MTDRYLIDELLEAVILEARYQSDMVLWQNTWWSRSDYALHLVGCEIPAEGRPRPETSCELLWFHTDWEGDEPRSLEHRISDLVDSRRAEWS